jgi:hypothetical protein
MFSACFPVAENPIRKCASHLPSLKYSRLIHNRQSPNTMLQRGRGNQPVRKIDLLWGLLTSYFVIPLNLIRLPHQYLRIKTKRETYDRFRY